MIKVDIGMPSSCEECPFRPCKEYRKYIKESRGWLPLNFRLEDCLIAELVRCKDCRWQEECSQFVVLNKFCGVYQEISFCSHGERKENVQAGEQLYTHEEVWANIDGRPHGEWLYRWNEVECSQCGEFFKDSTNFCPNCGADMRTEQTEHKLPGHADRVEVVRCKDCRHAEHREQMPNQIYCKRDKLSTFCAVHDDDDFCKYGEKLYTHEEVWGTGMTDRIKQCDVVDRCEDCPRYADDCDGEVEDE